VSAARHYDTLGLTKDASSAEIREAYRRLARVHHPDHGETDAGSMASINEAYRVLGDPGRRAVYDAALRGTGSAAGSASSPTVVRSRTAPLPVTDMTPARVPWKLMAGMAGVGIAVVLVGAVLYEPAGPVRPDNLLEPGSCVTIEANGDAREITCTGLADELVVRVLLPLEGPCPTGTVGYRDRQGRGLACVTSVR
jgi:DnaJ domain